MMDSKPHIVDEWVSEIDKLSIIALTQPQSTYACFTKGILHKYTYVMRTIPDISNLLQPLDEAIDAFIKFDLIIMSLANWKGNCGVYQ